METARREIIERFKRVVNAAGALALDEAALLVAAYERPTEVDVDLELQRLDELAGSITNPTLDGVCDVIFGELGFAGNAAAYYEPANSHLDQVVQRRKGIPITLAVVLIEVARRAGVPLFGVGMPGHFLVGDRVDGQLFVDPFRSGTRLTPGECAHIFTTMQGSAAEFRPEFLLETPRSEILMRIINNLRIIYQQAGQTKQLVRVLELMILLPGAPPAERKQLAAALERDGRIIEAVDQLETLADLVFGPEAEQLRSAAIRLLARLN